MRKHVKNSMSSWKCQPIVLITKSSLSLPTKENVPVIWNISRMDPNVIQQQDMWRFVWWDEYNAIKPLPLLVTLQLWSFPLRAEQCQIWTELSFTFNHWRHDLFEGRMCFDFYSLNNSTKAFQPTRRQNMYILAHRDLGFYFYLVHQFRTERSFNDIYK